MPSLEAQLCEEHAREASFLWLLRDRAVRDAAYDRASLAELDHRLEAHLDGLRLGGEAAWSACAELLSEPEGGEAFTATVVALGRKGPRPLARVLDLAAETPALARGVVSALGWTSFDRVGPLLAELLSPKASPAWTGVVIAAYAAHRRDPGAALGYALANRDVRVRARALRAAGELGRMDLLPELCDAQSSTDEACRFWAAWSGALLGDATATTTLWSLAQSTGPFAERAAAMAARRMEPSAARGRIQALAKDAHGVRVALGAAAALGDPSLVPWVLEHMRAPETARVAGSVLATIAGLNLEAEQLCTRPPEGFPLGPNDDPEDDDVAMDPDESLPWPDASAVGAWWSRNGAQLQRGRRHLLGREMTEVWMGEVLARGAQPARAAAAVELCLRSPGSVLFEVRAPGFAQGRTG